MRILCILDDDKFFHPNYMEQLYDQIKLKFNGEVIIAITKNIPKKSNLNHYFFKNIFKFYLKEFCKLFFLKIIYEFFDFIFPKGINKKFFSIKSFAKKNDIKTFNIYTSINKEFYKRKLKGLNLDFIISSNSLYFDNEILKIPKIACLNRHSSILPAYGGLLPVFHAISNNEKYCGVSIIAMNENIDEGKVIAQNKIIIEKNNLYFLYGILFKMSVSLTITAIERCLENTNNTIEESTQKSYFSFPTKKDWENFRKNSGRII